MVSAATEILLIVKQGIGPLAAALLNSTFIQGFELDDYHSEAPLHSNAILLPALFAAAEHETISASGSTRIITGKAFLLAVLVGYEVGPRVGLGLYGAHMLSMGWHSGAVFGPSASAASVSKLLEFPPNMVEDALGIACTQACGLMSAQYESMVKRMQHGFASRNGLFAALMARSGYVGIKQVFERPYGGFLSTFSQGIGKDPASRPDELTKDLGDKWHTQTIRVKPYGSMAGTHCTIDCIRALQQSHPEEMKDVHGISNVIVEMSEPAFKHGGWQVKRPLTVTGAQMSNSYVAALQLADGHVLPAQFHQEAIDRDDVWRLISKTICKQNDNLDNPWAQRVTIEFADQRPTLVQAVKAPKGIKPPMSNEEVVSKWRSVTKGIIDDERRQQIEDLVLDLDGLKDITALTRLLAGSTAKL